jgi:hypothetical protein
MEKVLGTETTIKGQSRSSGLGIPLGAPGGSCGVTFKDMMFKGG